jgi:hypothetical protein
MFAIKQAAFGIADPSIVCNLWESEVVEKLVSALGEEVSFGMKQKKAGGAMLLLDIQPTT